MFRKLRLRVSGAGHGRDEKRLLACGESQLSIVFSINRNRVGNWAAGKG